VINAWWAAVEGDHIVDPNIQCLSRDPEALDIQDENGDQIELEEGAELFLAPLDKTSPEVFCINLTWDGFNNEGLPIRLGITPRVHRETSRSRLLKL
jgi:hypothetical protein